MICMFGRVSVSLASRLETRLNAGLCWLMSLLYSVGRNMHGPQLL